MKQWLCLHLGSVTWFSPVYSSAEWCVLYYYLVSRWPAHQTILMSFMRAPFYYLFQKAELSLNEALLISAQLQRR